MSVSKFKFMLLVVVLNALLHCEIAASSVSHLEESVGVPKVGGGRNALPGEFPSFITLVSGFNQLRCGGVLINETLVLTAAFCLREGVGDVHASLDIRHPSTWKPKMNIKRTKVVKACRSKLFDKQLSIHDYQVLKLEKPITCVKPAKLNEDPNIIGDPVTVVGMGQNPTTGQKFPKTLQALESTIIECELDEDQHQTKICSRSEKGSACWGDNGGPLYKVSEQNEQVVVALTSNGNCFDRSVNAEISRNLEEIQELMLECSN